MPAISPSEARAIVAAGLRRGWIAVGSEKPTVEEAKKLTVNVHAYCLRDDSGRYLGRCGGLVDSPNMAQDFATADAAEARRTSAIRAARYEQGQSDETV